MPVCGATIELEKDVEAGEIVVCPECGAELEVRRTGKRIYLKEVEE